MSSKPAVVEPREQSELEQVEAWRLRCLLHAGWELEHAEIIAMLMEIDLHKACLMVRQGCTSKLAYSILS